MRSRVITALVLVPLVLAALLGLPGRAIEILLAIVIAYGAWEWSNFFPAATLLRRLVFVAVVAGLMGALHLLAGPSLRFPGMLEIAVLGWALTLIWVWSYPTPMPGFIAGLLGAVILVIAWAAMSLLAIAGWQWLLFLLLLIWAADVGAYFAGRRFGVRKLAPAVSPGKTWAGVFGGLALSMLVAAAGGWWFGMPMAWFILLCMVSVLLSILGDLMVSMFKRARGIKDSGKLLPGHGGVLDRIDSLLSASPVMVLGLVYLGAIQ